MGRIDTFLDPESADPDDTYHVDKSVAAIGSGGLTGDGYKQGNSVRNRFIPYAFSDSIFVVIGEEFGFVGAANAAVALLPAHLSDDPDRDPVQHDERRACHHRRRLDVRVSDFRKRRHAARDHAA